MTTFNPSTGGRLVTPLESFAAHVDGTDFHQPASSIITSPGINSATDLQTSLNNIQDFITVTTNSINYITVPKAYDSYQNAMFEGQYFDHTVPSLDSFLNPIFSDIISGTPLVEPYTRLKDGGIVLIPAGTYYVENSIVVPPGITLLGEGYGTKIVNASSLTISASPGPSGAAPQPVFIIAADGYRESDVAIDPNSFMFGKSSQLVNFVICDNFVEPAFFGDTNYLLSQNNGALSTTCGLIQQDQGSNLEIDNVKFMGRVHFSSGTIVDAATLYAIALDTTTPITTGTYLKITNCIMDGFSIPINFPSKGGCKDYLEVSNSKIRAHGYLAGGNGTSNKYNCLISMNDNNARIVSNDFYGNHQHCLTIVSILNKISSPPVLDSLSKILISTNTFIIDRGDTVSITPIPYFVDAGIVGSFDSYAVIMASENVYDATTGFELISGASGANILSASEANTVITASTAFSLSAPSINLTSGTTIDIASGAAQTVEGTLTIESAGILNIIGNETINGTSTVESGASIVINSGAALNNSGDLNIESGGLLTVLSGAILDIPSGGSQTVEGTLTLESGSTLAIDSGATFTISSASLSSSSVGQLQATDSNSNILIPSLSLHLISNAVTASASAVDTNLTFPVSATDIWHFEASGSCASTGTGTGGIQFAITIPTGATIEAQAFGASTATNAFKSARISSSGALTAEFNSGSVGTTLPITIKGHVKCDGSHAGNVTIQFAAFAQTANLIAGFSLVAIRSLGV